MENEKEFSLTVTGDHRELMDAIRKWDWCESSVADVYYQNFLDSWFPYFEDDPDSEGTFRIPFEGLDILCELLGKFLPVAREIQLWASGHNDEASFSIGFISPKTPTNDNPHKILMPRCESRIKSKVGKIAEAAHRAMVMIQEAEK